MSGVGEIKCYSYSSIPVQPFKVFTVHVTEVATIKAATVDVVESEKDIWATELQFLI